MKLFNQNPTRASRALQCYLILIGYAQRRQSITYLDLANQLGFDRAGMMGSFLGPIMAYCEREDVPALASIVVNKETGRAGIGFNTQGKDTAELQNEVFNFPWSNFYPPTEAELQESKCGEHLAA
jgi:hypothetical protein